MSARRSVRLQVVVVLVEDDERLAGMVAGAVYSGLYMVSKNLWSPILAHAVTNGTLAAWVLASGEWTFW